MTDKGMKWTITAHETTNHCTADVQFGATENAGVENAIRAELQGRKMQE